MASPEVQERGRDAVGEATPRGRKIRHLRWYVCGILFLATTINYLDRQALGVLNPILKREIGWDDSGFGWINFAFQLAYAIMFGVSGRLLDLFGVRAGMIWAVCVWSVAAMSHAFARSALGFSIARFALGLGEAANFPACIKAVAEWFPKRERAFATGIFNAGTNVGVMLSPIVVYLAIAWHWQAAFVLTGLTGFAWVMLWARFYRAPESHPNLSESERDLILSDKDPVGTAVRVPWTSLLRYRQAWAFLLGKMFTDPVWWFYLTWLPTYLVRERGVSPQIASLVLLYPYIAADFGSVGGGFLSGFLMKRGWPVGRARLAAMTVFALCMPGAIWAVFAKDLWMALTLISLATSAHQAWSANIFTISSDMFPKKVVGSMVGLGGMAGAIGGMFMQLIAGAVLGSLGTYVPLFVLAGIMHPIALLTIVGFAGRNLAPADVEEGLKSGRSPNLVMAGMGVTLAGVALAGGVLLYWDTLAARSLSATVQGLTASVGVALLGLALLYAGRGRQAPTSA